MATHALVLRDARPVGSVLEGARRAIAFVATAAEGLLVGLVVSYIAFSALGAPANFLGVPDPVAIVLIGGATLVLAGTAAALALGARAMIVRGTGRLTAARAVAGHRSMCRILGIPASLLAVLPIGWLGAMVALLWIALVGRASLAPVALLTPPGALVPWLYLVGIAGGVLAVAVRLLRPGRDGRPPGRWRRGGGLSLVVLTVVVLVAAGSVAWWPGSGGDVIPTDRVGDGVLLTTTLEDPGTPGPYAVEKRSYGTGTDARRPAFGADVDLVTMPVDASRVLPELGSGADEARAWFWGFGTDAMPIQGLAWLPVGDGPFPLVLIAHGNHAMGDFSEPGYGYLAEHLASRGFVAVSIDQDFLNGAWAGEYHGEEQLVRAWLLLLHLDAWRAWAGPGGLFEGRVDLDRVALIGHSRGGEAASVAASLADYEQAPRSGLDPWPRGLEVDAVVSIAPSDGQYPNPVILDGIDFLTLQGGWDADARAWSGIRQLARSKPDEDGFVAGLWSYRANHGRFNTTWGASDHGPFGGAVLDLAATLDARQQEDLARTAIGAFLEASLHGQDGYRDLFRRPMIGRGWLPDDIVVVRSRSGDAIELAPARPDQPVEGVGLAVTGATARTRPVPLKALQLDQGCQATEIRWTAGAGVASWTIDGLGTVVDGRPAWTGPSAVRIALADARTAESSDGRPLSVTVRLTAGEVSVALTLERFGALPPPLPVRLAKHDALAAMAGIDLTLRSSSEIVLQTYELPIAAFVAEDPAFDPARLSALTLEVDRSADGGMWISEPALLP